MSLVGLLRSVFTVVGLVAVAVMLASGLTVGAPPELRLALAATLAWALSGATRPTNRSEET